MNNRGRVWVLWLLFTLAAGGSVVWGSETEEGLIHRGTSQLSTQDDGGGFNLGAWLASLFRDHLSAVDSDRCPSEPSCSAYSVNAFKKHGFFVGWVMTVDRLIHEADEDEVSPLSYKTGQGKTYDPVENNDFWWFSRDQEPPQ